MKTGQILDVVINRGKDNIDSFQVKVVQVGTTFVKCLYKNTNEKQWSHEAEWLPLDSSKVRMTVAS